MNGLGDTDVPRKVHWYHCLLKILTGHSHKSIGRNIHDRDRFGGSWEEYGSSLWGIYADLRCRVFTQISAVVLVRRSKTLPASRVGLDYMGLAQGICDPS